MGEISGKPLESTQEAQGQKYSTKGTKTVEVRESVSLQLIGCGHVCDTKHTWSLCGKYYEIR